MEDWHGEQCGLAEWMQGSWSDTLDSSFDGPDFFTFDDNTHYC